jgi:hydroxyacyl-ACP dehydratase HTD2-like protein with hotdog domain
MKPPRFRLSVRHQIIGARNASTAAARIKESLLSRSYDTVYDRLDEAPQNLLHTSLSSFLPPSPAHYRERRILQPGSHLVYFPPAVPERDLLPDGTDTLHAPDPSYKFRLWAGGDVAYPHIGPITLHHSRDMTLKERIVDVKVKGDGDEKSSVWVKIQREIGGRAPGQPFRNPDYRTPDSFATPLVIENRWLVFFKSSPPITLDKITAPPTDPSYEVKLKTTPALLFRFSALTFNAHAIHLDPVYSRREYGLPERLVHGPLTFVLMMEVLARRLDQYVKETEGQWGRFVVRHVEYKNVMPILVGEEISVCCKRMETVGRNEHSEEHERAQQQWEIWVQKKVNGKPSLCVKGVARVERRLPLRSLVSSHTRDFKGKRLPT